MLNPSLEEIGLCWPCRLVYGVGESSRMAERRGDFGGGRLAGDGQAAGRIKGGRGWHWLQHYGPGPNLSPSQPSVISGCSYLFQ